MRLVGRALLVVAAVGALTGCQPPYVQVTLSGSLSAPLITVSEPTPARGKGRAPIRLERVDVYAGEGHERLWSLYARSDCPSGSRVTYGIAPAGYASEAPAAPLGENQVYRVRVEACHSRKGYGEFVFRDGAWSEVR